VEASLLRAAAFLAGLLGLRGTEIRAPHHAPTAPLGRRWVANLGLGVVNGVVVSLAYAACYALGARDLVGRLAPLRLLPPSPWVQIPLAIVLLDLVTYLLHRAYHRVPVLWRLHLVHHTDLDLDVSSASRFHTGEVVLSSFLKIGVVAILGITPAGLVAFEIAMLACAQFQHANVRLAPVVERALWRTFVPPAMHRIHHAPDVRDTNSNFGTILTLWDVLLGTFNRRAPGPAPSFGLERFRDARALGFGALAALPFRR